MQKTGLTKKKLGVICAVLLIAVIVLVAAFWFVSKQKNNSSSQTSQAEIESITKKVGLLMELPGDESPAVATVSDVTKLQGEVFFKNAKNGDKVLAYAKNNKAIIYRPNENKIIEVAFYNPPVADKPISSQSAQQGVAGAKLTPTAAAKIKVTVYNGTKTAGLAKTKGGEISSSFDQVEIAGTSNASGDFSETLVIDITGNNKVLAVAIAKSLNGKIGALPNSELKPNADILVILGSK